MTKLAFYWLIALALLGLQGFVLADWNSGYPSFVNPYASSSVYVPPQSVAPQSPIEQPIATAPPTPAAFSPSGQAISAAPSAVHEQIAMVPPSYQVPTPPLAPESPTCSDVPVCAGKKSFCNSRFGRFFANCQLIPNGEIYPAYLADVNESRIAGVWNKDENIGWVWDATLGGRVACLRIGSRECSQPTGFQVDFEGSAHLRLDYENSFDLYSTDYRAGLPITWGGKYWQFKSGYMHVSSHLGDEYYSRVLERELGNGEWFSRYRFRESISRDSLLLGVAFRPRPDVRLYAEGDFDLGGAGSENEDRGSYCILKFGVEYSAPLTPNAPNRWNCWNLPNLTQAKPFAAIHANIYEELDYSGNLCIQIGFQNRGSNNQLFRFGLQYFYGASEQYQFFQKSPPENKFGFGLWFDY